MDAMKKDNQVPEYKEVKDWHLIDKIKINQWLNEMLKDNHSPQSNLETPNKKQNEDTHDQDFPMRYWGVDWSPLPKQDIKSQIEKEIERIGNLQRNQVQKTYNISIMKRRNHQIEILKAKLLGIKIGEQKAQALWDRLTEDNFVNQYKEHKFWDICKCSECGRDRMLEQIKKEFGLRSKNENI